MDALIVVGLRDFIGLFDANAENTHNCADRLRKKPINSNCTHYIVCIVLPVKSSDKIFI